MLPAALLTLLILSNPLIAAGSASGDPPAATVISPDPGRYFNGWPTVTRLRDGRLFLVWSGGRDAHACPFGRLEAMISRDEGATWSWPRVLHDSAIDERDGGVLETVRGTLLVTTFGSMVFENPAVRSRYAQQPEKWARAAAAGPAAELAYLAGPQILRSEDGGTTWSAAQPVPVNSPHGPLQLSDGRLLYAGVSGVGKARFYRPGERQVGVWESGDDGRTWAFLAPIPVRPGDKPEQYHELHGIQAADGTIVVLIRSHSGEREMLQTVSRDGGRSWSEPHSIGVYGYPPHLLRLRDGRLLLSYDHRRTPFGVQVRVSADQGAIWSEPFVISRQPKKLDQGYPSSVELPGGDLLTVWYEVPPGEKKAVLKQARWSLTDAPQAVDSTPLTLVGSNAGVSTGRSPASRSFSPKSQRFCLPAPGSVVLRLPKLLRPPGSLPATVLFPGFPP